VICAGLKLTSLRAKQRPAKASVPPLDRELAGQRRARRGVTGEDSALGFHVGWQKTKESATITFTLLMLASKRSCWTTFFMATRLDEPDILDVCVGVIFVCVKN